MLVWWEFHNNPRHENKHSDWQIDKRCDCVCVSKNTPHSRGIILSPSNWVYEHMGQNTHTQPFHRYKINKDADFILITTSLDRPVRCRLHPFKHHMNTESCTSLIRCRLTLPNTRCKWTRVIVTCRLSGLKGNNAPECWKAITRMFLNVKHGFKRHLCTWHISRKITTKNPAFKKTRSVLGRGAQQQKLAPWVHFSKSCPKK